MVYLGSLSGGDALWPETDPPPDLDRFWQVYQPEFRTSAAPANLVEQFRFESGRESKWIVVLYGEAAK